MITFGFSKRVIDTLIGHDTSNMYDWRSTICKRTGKGVVFTATKQSALTGRLIELLNETYSLCYVASEDDCHHQRLHLNTPKTSTTGCMMYGFAHENQPLKFIKHSTFGWTCGLMKSQSQLYQQMTSGIFHWRIRLWSIDEWRWWTCMSASILTLLGSPFIECHRSPTPALTVWRSIMFEQRTSSCTLLVVSLETVHEPGSFACN